MAKIINDTERLKICESCPLFWGKTVCDQIIGNEFHAEKTLRVFCVHVDACNRAFRKGLIYDVETGTDESV